MANTVNMLKTAVAGFLQRTQQEFVRTGPPEVDLLLHVVNNARLYAERKIDFELSKCDMDVAVASIAVPGNLANAVLHGTATAVSVKKVITPYLALADGNQWPVDLWTRKKWDDRVKKKFEMARPSDTAAYAYVENAPYKIIRDGNTLFVAPLNTTDFPGPFTIFINGVRWLTPYTTGAENDFLLDYCFDWMMYRSLMELSVYLKEDERAAALAPLLNDAWDSMVKWNNELVMSSTDDVDLD